MGVCLFVSRLCKKLGFSTNIHKIRWKGGTWATEETLDFASNPCHIALELGVQLAGDKSYPLSL